MEKYVKIKACPRCMGGDLFIEQDRGEWYEHCIQCSYTRELQVTFAPSNRNSPVQPSSIDDKVTSADKSGQGRNKGTSQNIYKLLSTS